MQARKGLVQETEAATLIQATFRGSQARKGLGAGAVSATASANAPLTRDQELLGVVSLRLRSENTLGFWGG